MILSPFFHFSRINNWIPAPKPKIFRDTNITLLHADEVSPHVIRLLFQASGPDHMGIYFSPKSGVTLTTWSFSEGELLEGPKWKDDRPTYYIFHSGGLSPAPWRFWLQFKVRYSFIYLFIFDHEKFLRILRIQNLGWIR